VVPSANPCRREGINHNLYYRWSKDFLEAGKRRLSGDTVREASTDEVVHLKKENASLKQAVAELYLRNDWLKRWLNNHEIEHTRGAPYHPMTQGKIERYHRTIKNLVKLENYYYPWQLEKAIADWVQHYNHERYHESLDNVTPSHLYQGRSDDIPDQRAIIKSRTMMRKKVQNLRLAG
jgi:transposase InsO family protein